MHVRFFYVSFKSKDFLCFSFASAQLSSFKYFMTIEIGKNAKSYFPIHSVGFIQANQIISHFYFEEVKCKKGDGDLLRKM